MPHTISPFKIFVAESYTVCPNTGNFTKNMMGLIAFGC